MHNARIGLFEDHQGIRGLLTEVLEMSGHTVPIVAANMDEARKIIDGIQDDEIDVALVDGDLGSGIDDGVEIVRLLHSRFEGLVVIGNSGRGDVEGADLNAGKCGPGELLTIIAGIPQPGAS